MVPHSYKEFDASCHLTLADMEFKKTEMNLTIKWSKTNQTRDRVHTVILP